MPNLQRLINHLLLIILLKSHKGKSGVEICKSWLLQETGLIFALGMVSFVPKFFKLNDPPG